jgi:Flp pilus assembly protein TadD
MQAGVQLFQQGQLAAAVEAFDRATQLFPDRPEGWVNLGAGLVELGRNETAVQALLRAIRLNPDYFVAHMVLGDAWRQLGDWSKSTACYHKAVALERAPMALNKLACALRGVSRAEEAEPLYREAIEKEPAFTLARVNLATTLVEMKRFDQAKEQLDALSGSRLSSSERAEVDSARLGLSEYFRLAGALSKLGSENGLESLAAKLQETPETLLREDETVLANIERYAKSAERLPEPAAPEAVPLPAEWPLVEAMFMIPFVKSVEEYVEVRAALERGTEATGDLLESVNMKAVNLAIRAARDDLRDPVRVEAHLRHWHWLASQGVPGLLSGHFKYTQNRSYIDPARFRRAFPAMVSGTIRKFSDTIYRRAPAGLPRAALALLAVCDIHPFADGNGRIAIAWMNRELEWAGLMPAVFSRETGFRGTLNQAIWHARDNGGDLSRLYLAIADGQRQAGEFLANLGQA